MQIRGLISSCATLFALLRASLLVILLALLVAWKASAIVDWTRAAWILRELPRPSGNIVYSGVRRLLTGKRLRVMQAVNESVVGGSGVFYYNILWGHVCCLQSFASDSCSGLSLSDSRACSADGVCTSKVSAASRTQWGIDEPSYQVLHMQMVVVSEPRLVAELLHNTNLAKPTYPVMIHFRQVSLN